MSLKKGHIVEIDEDRKRCRYCKTINTRENAVRTHFNCVELEYKKSVCFNLRLPGLTKKLTIIDSFCASGMCPTRHREWLEGNIKTVDQLNEFLIDYEEIEHFFLSGTTCAWKGSIVYEGETS